MTQEMNWNDNHLENVHLISLSDVSGDDELKQAFSWLNTQPLSKEDKLINFSNYMIKKELPEIL